MKLSYNFLDKRDKEERLTFNVLVGRHLRDITLVIGILQVLFAILAFIDRLNPTVRSSIYMVETLADDSFWAGAYLISGSLVLISMQKPNLRAIAMAVSAACYFVWGILIFFKSITAIQPVAWSLGLTMTAFGVVAYKACLSWNVLMFSQNFGSEDITRVEDETLH